MAERWKLTAFDIQDTCHHQYNQAIPCDCTLAVVKCAPGDVEAFNAAVDYGLRWYDWELPVAAPVFGWFRWNPDPTGEYKGLIAQAKGPGRGNWTGAFVVQGTGPTDGEAKS